MGTDAVIFKGVVHGKMIELEQAPGLPEGQEVRVTVQAASSNGSSSGDGLRRAFGAWGQDAQDLDQFLEWNRQQRKFGRKQLGP